MGRPSALALDIDGTITTAEPAVVQRLVAAAKECGAHVAINTARPQRYCDAPFAQTLAIAAVEDHYCYGGPFWSLRNVFLDVPASKLDNMRAIQKKGGVLRPACCVLVDDRPENVAAVRQAGFGAVLVEAKRGITPGDATAILGALRQCAVEAAAEPAGPTFGPQPR